jgi:hypothetical protein
VTVTYDGPLTMADAPPVETGQLGDLMNGLAALTAATPDYERAAAYYEDRVPEFFASIRLRRAMARSGIGFRFNLAAVPVDAVVERLKLAAVTCTDPAGDAALRELWLRNKIALQSRQWIRRACEFGDAYVIVWPAPDGSGVDISYNSPQCMRMFYDLENPLLKSHAVKRWQLADKTWRADVYYPARIEKWVTKPAATGDKPGDWLQFTDDDAEWPVPNPFGEIPVFHFRTDWPYGVPEHKGFYGPQDAIHKLILSHLAGVDYQAFPQRYAMITADTDSSEAAATDEDEFAFADTGAGGTVPPLGEARSDFVSDPGSLWYMKGVTGVGQFTTADHANFTEPMMSYLRLGAEITNTPLHRIDPSGDMPSGESFRASEAPFVHKVEDRQLMLGDTARETFTFALLVAGFPAADVTVRWTPAQTVNDLEGWQVVAQKIAVGVPKDQAFLEAGYSDEQVEAWFGPEGERPTPVPGPAAPPPTRIH